MASSITLGAATISGGRPVLGPDGTGIFYQRVTGWDDPPGIRFESIERSGAHGDTAGRGWLGARTLVIEGFVWCPAANSANLREAVDRLVAAIPIDADAKLVFAEQGITRHLMVRQGGQPMVDRIGRTVGRHVVASFNIQLLALEPRRLAGSGPATITKALPFGTAVAVDTGGRIEAPTVIEVTGPVDSGAKLACGGRTLTIGQAVTAGQVLKLDLERRKATINGTDIGTTITGLWPKPTKAARSFTLTASGSGSANVKAWEAWS